jgi:hypothetical protein
LARKEEEGGEEETKIPKKMNELGDNFKMF